jgi:hypothetical protein
MDGVDGWMIGGFDLPCMGSGDLTQKKIELSRMV